MAPSAENSQPWVFVVVRDPAGRAEIARLTEAAWSGGARAYSQGRLDPALLADVERGATGGIAAAPVLVVVGADLNRCHRATIGSSLFPAIQNLLLAATACGLGSALTTLSTGDAAGLSAAVGFPEHVVPVAVVPLGRPERSLGPPRREPVETKAHDGRYGTPWPSRP